MLITRALPDLLYNHLLSYPEDLEDASHSLDALEKHAMFWPQKVWARTLVLKWDTEMWDANQLAENLYRQSVNKVTANKKHWLLKETITDKLGAKI